MEFVEYLKNKSTQLSGEFFDAKFQQIEKNEKLSIILAKHAQYLHDELLELWNSTEKSLFKEKLQGLYSLFSKTLIEDLKPDEFIDAYTQTVTYGLLLSALSANKKIDKYNFIEFLPKSLSIFNEIFGLLQLANIPERISSIIDKLFITLNNTDYSQIQKELPFKDKKGLETTEDPYIYFYENFLSAYNQVKRLEKGVYYTPAAVVHFIVKTIQQSLIQDFKKSGLDDDNISLLDFAAGTGTFLLEAYKTALENVDKEQRNTFIRNNLLNHFFGFECVITPYTVAHLKLSKYLTQEGFTFKPGDHAKVFLTDTLDNAYYQQNPLFPYISDEGEQAAKIKMQEKLWVILGNPPYSNFSKNKKPFIQNLVNDYKIGLKETKINLDDDYIKFIRFAQAKIEGKKYNYRKGKNTVSGEIQGAGQGIIGVITNNSYLTGVTHRAMRKSLMETFDKIYILNLHGNSIIGEPDKNVFDIRIGVSIAFFIKTPKPLKKKEVWYFSSLENNLIEREEKYQFLYKNDRNTVNWKILNPQKPYYWFVDKDLKNQMNYDKGWGVNKIFDIYSSGIQTKRDALTINFTKKHLETKLYDLQILDIEKYRQKYSLPSDGRDWSITDAKQKSKTYKKHDFSKILYRPFDFRFTYINEQSRGFVTYPRYKVMQHFINKENIGLLFTRNWSSFGTWNVPFITEKISDIHVIGGQSYIAPLYIYNSNSNYDENRNGFLFKDEAKKDNFTTEFRRFLNKNKLQDYSPEQILAYIYAILFCPAYREKYFEFFKIDFPKIPFIKNRKVFNKLSELGNKLIENHLLKVDYAKKEMPVFAVEGNNKIDNYYYDKNKQRLYINKTQYIEPFIQSVWEYEIGGYQVFDKYLKARKKMELSYEEINHLKKVAASIKKTIEIQAAIDNLCSTRI